MENNATNIPIVYGMLCTVISPNKKVVLLKRSPDKKVYPNLWSVVGAYPFKDKFDACEIALREISDELGLIGEVLEIGSEIVNQLELEDRTIELHIIPVLAKVSSENVNLNEEHTDYKWVSIDEIVKFELAPGMLEIINSVHTKKHLDDL